MFKKTLFLTSTLITLMSPLAYSDDSLNIAKQLIASQMQVSSNNIGPDEPLSEIGVGGDQLDIIELVMSTEDLTQKEITDAQLEQVIGLFDESAAERMTANKLAKLISEL